MTSLFQSIDPAPKDPIFAIAQACKEDTFEKKVDLGVGAYRDNNGKPVVFECVRKAGKKIYENPQYNKEYLPMGGDPTFLDLSQRLVFGEESSRYKAKTIASVQTLSGTGALTIAGNLLRLVLDPATTRVYVSDPTWPIHVQMYGEQLGFQICKYPYWDPSIKGANVAGMIKCLEEAPEHSIVILHTCAHNPTGEDPNMEQWKEIAEVLQRKKLVPIMDTAYQGFASDIAKDVRSVRLMDEMGLEFFVCQSYAKNMGLYGERCGACHYVLRDKDLALKVKGRMARLCRGIWSNPPKHGMEIAKLLLSDPDLNAQWRVELQDASDRICDMRAALRNCLEKRGTPGTWTHLTNQIGMFSFTGLTEEQCKHLTDVHHIYLTKTGRISMAGVNTSNVEYIADAIDDAVRNH